MHFLLTACPTCKFVWSTPSLAKWCECLHQQEKIWTLIISLDDPSTAHFYAQAFAAEVSQITYRAHLWRVQYSSGSDVVTLQAVPAPAMPWREKK